MPAADWDWLILAALAVIVLVTRLLARRHPKLPRE